MMKFYAFLLIANLFSLSQISNAQTGQALDFDGVNDYVSIPSPTFIAYTIEVRVKFNGSTANQNIIVGTNATGPTNAWSHQIKTDAGGHFVHYLFDESDVVGRQVVGTTVALPGVWYTVSVTASNFGPMELYVNGVNEGSSGLKVLWTGGNQFHLGSGTSTGTSTGSVLVNQFNGQMDEVRIWNQQLAASVISANYATSASAPQAGLIRLYRFNQGAPAGDNTALATLTDASGNNIDGVLNNFAGTGASSNFVSPVGTLPVKLSSFVAEKEQNAVHLTWSTVQEVNSDYFDIERSSDNIDYSSIGRIRAAGNSTYLVHYRFEDKAPGAGTNFYRLKMVDRDEKYTYSKVLLIRGKEGNPVNLSVNAKRMGAAVSLEIQSPRSGKAFLLVYNNAAQVIAQRPLTFSKGSSQQVVPFDQLTNQVYYYKLVEGNQELAKGKF